MKKFLLKLLGAYIVAAVVGILLFHSPGYSRQYLKQYGHEHERYHKTNKNEEYIKYIERPNLHHADDHLLADVAFMKEYEARPEFQAEKRRMFRYSMYYKALNSIVFFLLVWRGLSKPVADFLDKSIAEMRAGLSDAEKARKEAQQAKAAAQAKMDQWAPFQEQLSKDTDAAINGDLAVIANELDAAERQFAKETEDRRQAEVYRAARLLREELVTQAMTTLEQRYRTEATQERITNDVGKFVRLMDRLS